MKQASMRPDQLLTITQGVRGNKKHSNIQGMTKLVVQKGFNEPSNSIEIDTFKGLGHTYEQRETALLSISFTDGTEWSGSFDDLKNKLLV